MEQNTATTAETEPAHSPRLLEAWNDYIKDKGQKWRKQTANENQRFFDVLYHVVGDVPVDSVKKQPTPVGFNLVTNPISRGFGKNIFLID